MKHAFRIAFAAARRWRFPQLVSPSLSHVISALQNPSQQEVEHLKHRLSDWAQLSFYQQANAELLPLAREENHIVFFGDSITEFWDLATYFPGRPCITCINRGIAGQTTPQLLIRFRPDVIALQPRVVLILAGTNDIAGNTGSMTISMIEDNYTSIAELAQINRIQVIFASILPTHDYSSAKQFEGRSPAKIQALNDWLQHYCTEHHHIYLDYYNSMLDSQGMLRADLSDDGLHPNARGYAVMAPLAEAAIEQALQQLEHP